jgi:16S rRNA (cytosine967-C5)-methyltransferase
MTPAARQAAAISILDRHAQGGAAEALLTQWGRASRYAGSGDREAVRDLVYTVLRRRRSLAALGGGADGRAALLGLARETGAWPAWDGTGHGPDPLTDAERALLSAPLPILSRGAALDCPDWLLGHFDRALGETADSVLHALRERAPLFLRVNTARATLPAVRAELAADGIETRTHPLAQTALEVTVNPRRLRASAAYLQGRVEVQDAASQAVAAAVAGELAHQTAPAHVNATQVLDYCAGGGGKALALAAAGFKVSAHDADPARMRDLPARAARAGVQIALCARPDGQWPAVFADAPCSGSGSWRRAPEAKWRLTPERLQELCALQAQILDRCAALVAPGGLLAYATCSLFAEENTDQATAFDARRPAFTRLRSLAFTPLDGGDGFFLAMWRRKN